MMSNRRSCKASLSPAQLVEGMPFKECFPGLPPRGSVALVGAGISLVAFVGARSLFRMLLAVPTVGEMWTAWVAARSLGLVGHGLCLRGLQTRSRMNEPTVESGELRKDSRQRLGQYRRGSLLGS